ncbi:HPr family phosphocarrier protein [Magnetospira thiophila]
MRDDNGPDGFSRELTIVNQRGLHARAASKFVKVVGAFDALVEVTRGDQTVSGLSIMGLMLLAAGPGTSIQVNAAGPEAEVAIEAISALVNGKFEEE